MEAPSNFTTSPETPLQLLLFVDKRPSSGEKIRQIRSRLNALGKDYPFDLQIIDVGDQPHLVEHFKLVATPALIKQGVILWRNLIIGGRVGSKRSMNFGWLMGLTRARYPLQSL